MRIQIALVCAVIVADMSSGGPAFAQSAQAADPVAEVRQTLDAARKEVATYEAAGGALTHSRDTRVFVLDRRTDLREDDVSEAARGEAAGGAVSRNKTVKTPHSRTLLRCAVTLAAVMTSVTAQTPQKATSLFDGKNLLGWEGDTARTWRVEDGAIAGGSLSEAVPRNEFLTTTRSYGNFILRLKFKLVGTDGFINSGVQFRSQRPPSASAVPPSSSAPAKPVPPNEMIGYQADLGEGYWGSLYDESRRNKVLVHADAKQVKEVLRLNEWNDYEIRAEGRRIRLFINGRQTVDYTEPDAAIPQSGLIGLQIHGGGKAKVFFKDITIEELR